MFVCTLGLNTADLLKYVKLVSYVIAMFTAMLPVSTYGCTYLIRRALPSIFVEHAQKPRANQGRMLARTAAYFRSDRQYLLVRRCKI